jgi:hypothetical protein
MRVDVRERLHAHRGRSPHLNLLAVPRESVRMRATVVGQRTPLPCLSFECAGRAGGRMRCGAVRSVHCSVELVQTDRPTDCRVGLESDRTAYAHRCRRSWAISREMQCAHPCVRIDHAAASRASGRRSNADRDRIRFDDRDGTARARSSCCAVCMHCAGDSTSPLT